MPATPFPAIAGTDTFSLGYDAASRLSTVSDGTNTATYFYVANSPLVDHIIFAHNGSAVMTNQNTYDKLNRLTGISSASSASSVVNSQYQYNSASQRARVTLLDGSYWLYAYDSLGQLTSAVKYFRDGTPYAGQQFVNAYDTIGNRTSAQAGGDATGATAALRQTGYTNNLLNQIVSRNVPSYVDVMGLTLSSNTVKVNGTNAYQKWEYFREQLGTNNSNAPQWVGVTVTAPGQTTISGGEYLAQNPESFTYDLDGNQLSDGRFNYTWDAENRLISAVSLTSAPAVSMSSNLFTYDYQGRRIQKAVWTNSESGWVMSYANKFLYDGWNLAAILDGSNNPLYTFIWGTDLSGTMQGAGGVGGLISMTICTGANAGTYFPCYDGNGNVVAMVNAANGSIALNCEYGPFGELIRATGQLAKLTPLLFSTKYYDWETGLYYYGYRYYNPSTGKWLSRDPAGEQGGMNLYGLIGNDPINSFDLLDLLDYYLGSTDPTYTPPPTGQKPVSPTFGLKAERFAAAAAAGVASTEWPIAADLLEHYLSASGTPVSMDVYDMLDDSRSARDTYANELYEAKKFAATLAKKPNGDYDIDSRTLSQGEFSKSDNADWFYAIGRYASWGKGVAHVKDCKVTLEFTYEFRKRYQFQVDQDKYVSILGLKITDAQMGELQEAGLAKDFDISGSADRTVVVDITGDNPPGQTPPPGRTPGR